MKKKVFYFDCETTGLDKKMNEIVQLAYQIEIDGKLELERDLLIRPNRPDAIDEQALNVIGKTKEQLLQNPLSSHDAYEELIKDFAKFCNKFDVTDKFYPAGYNVTFDLDFLAQLFADNNDKFLGSWINWKVVDGLPLVRFMDFCGTLKLENYKLETVCNHFDIDISAHNALSDISATRQLIKRLSDKANS